MPEQFEECRQAGGKIRRKSGPSEEHGLGEGEYVDYCIRPDGSSVRGYVKQKGEGEQQEMGE